MRQQQQQQCLFTLDTFAKDDDLHYVSQSFFYCCQSKLQTLLGCTQTRKACFSIICPCKATRRIRDRKGAMNTAKDNWATTPQRHNATAQLHQRSTTALYHYAIAPLGRQGIVPLRHYPTVSLRLCITWYLCWRLAAPVHRCATVQLLYWGTKPFYHCTTIPPYHCITVLLDSWVVV